MEGVVERETLTQRVIAIQSNEVDISDLLNEYRPFIRTIVLKTTGKAVSIYGDEMAVAQLAFVESVKNYDADKGHFLTFSQWVIRRRLIDYYRKQLREQKEIVFSNLPANVLRKINDTEASRQIDDPIKLEIKTLSEDLQVYGIKFEDLVKASPKAKKTKRACKLAVQYVMVHDHTLRQLMTKHRLPIVDIQKSCDIPRKLLERHRKYIIAVVEILLGDYPYLKEYVGGYVL